MEKNYERHISYQTAVRAKEKGFQIPVCHWYNTHDPEFGTRVAAPLNHNYKPWGNTTVSAPTQEQLKTWLWEEHQIWVEVTLWGDGIGFQCMIKYTDGIEDDDSAIVRSKALDTFMTKWNLFDTTELGLQEGLKLIKDDN